MTTYEPQTNLLRRQLKKACKKDGSCDFKLLLELVDRAYDDNIKERRMADTTLKIMSTELLESNRELRKQAEVLKKSRDQLLEVTHQASQAARLSGMAEVATNILHNIGNILNSVNTSVALLIEKFKSTKFNNLDKLADMLEEHKEDYLDYFTNDPKGKYVPAYFHELANYWREQYPLLAYELTALSKNIDHIKDCIAMQQTMATNSGMIEPTNVSKLLDSIIEIQSKEAKVNNITFSKEYTSIPDLILDRIKLYQIFMNLIQNARQSVIMSDTLRREIIIKIDSDKKDNITISVTDTGIGISSKNLKKIFSHGFTTKKDGHGFGLHYCANAAIEMGGKMYVDSPGEGKGATFSLILPYKPVDQVGETDAA